MALRIAVDYDNTFTADKGNFTWFMEKMMNAGHDVFVVTFRNEELDWAEDFDLLYTWHGIKTYCTNGKAKKAFMESKGVKVDIWIDDNPAGILNDSPLTKEEEEEWRKTRTR